VPFPSRNKAADSHALSRCSGRATSRKRSAPSGVVAVDGKRPSRETACRRSARLGLIGFEKECERGIQPQAHAALVRSHFQRKSRKVASHGAPLRLTETGPCGVKPRRLVRVDDARLQGRRKAYCEAVGRPGSKTSSTKLIWLVTVLGGDRFAVSRPSAVGLPMALVWRVGDDGPTRTVKLFTPQPALTGRPTSRAAKMPSSLCGTGHRPSNRSRTEWEGTCRI